MSQWVLVETNSHLCNIPQEGSPQTSDTATGTAQSETRPSPVPVLIGIAIVVYMIMKGN